MNFLQGIADAAAATSIWEWAGVATAIAYVVFAAKESQLCWPFAIISSGIYTYICYNARLYPETGLQVFYLGMAVAGWIQWHKPHTGENIIHSVKFPKLLPWLLAASAFAILMGFVFASYSNAAQPWLDAAITSFSLLATWLVVKKVIENWILWILIDAASVVLFFNRGLMLTALLFALYTVLAVYGYIQWKKALRT